MSSEIPTDSDREPAMQRPGHSVHLSESVEIGQWLRLLVVLASLLLIVGCLAVAVKLLSAIGHTLLMFSLALLICYALTPLISLVRRTRSGVPRPKWVGILAVYGGLVLIAGLGVALLSAETVRQTANLARDHVHLEAEARRQLAMADAWLMERNVHVNLEEYLNNPPPNVRSWGEATAHSALQALTAASKTVMESIIVVLISMYFVIFGPEMMERVNRGLPQRVRPYAEQWQIDVNRILGGFVRGQILLAIVMGVGAGVGCMLLGVRFWLLIGLFVTAASLVPVIGPVVGAVPAVISAALSPPGHFPGPVAKVAMVILLFVIITESGSKILYPRLVGKALGLHEVLVLFVLFAGLEIGGLTGVLFAAPLTALAVTTAIQVHRLWRGEPPVSVADLAAREKP